MKKTALITGASSGIGKEFAKIHAEKGGDLIIVARSEDKLNELKNELQQAHNVQVIVIAKDLTDTNAPKEIYEELNAANIEVDYLINNAGFGGIGRFDKRDLEKDLSMIQLNITALTALTHYFLQDFVARNTGKILNVSSTASFMPGPMQAVYYATKAYVTSFSNAIAEELHDTNISVTTLMPGATETDFGKTSGMDKTELFENTASPRTVAEDGYNSMLESDLDVISGITFSQKILMKLLPFIPKKTMLKRIRKMQEV
ncbi:SDR family NAD(P)-dependent oxidoreductase [Kordia jejudonensis]|uniref:SDR family NAD(P)-dependent oxidoreductase n=1 Tax=Kordia jejudonensis TaxID=1348245 RepID=UPI000629038A|nr:SDR family oxidoreductase [Kordia jejudonensis]